MEDKKPVITIDVSGTIMSQEDIDTFVKMFNEKMINLDKGFKNKFDVEVVTVENSDRK